MIVYDLAPASVAIGAGVEVGDYVVAIDKRVRPRK